LKTCLFSLLQYDSRVNTSLISLIPIQGKNAAEHTFVCAVHESAVVAGDAANVTQATLNEVVNKVEHLKFL
jgi:hypothetical protein